MGLKFLNVPVVNKIQFVDGRFDTASLKLAAEDDKTLCDWLRTRPGFGWQDQFWDEEARPESVKDTEALPQLKAKVVEQEAVIRRLTDRCTTLENDNQSLLGQYDKLDLELKALQSAGKGRNTA